MSGSLEFDGSLTCALSVTDLERALAWYQEMLGFELLYKVDELAWCELKTPVARVCVGLSEVEQPVVQGGGATLTFGVRDVAAARAELEGKGVRFDGPTMTHQGMVKLATFFDPDQNAFMLAEDLSQAAPAP